MKSVTRFALAAVLLLAACFALRLGTDWLLPYGGDDAARTAVRALERERARHVDRVDSARLRVGKEHERNVRYAAYRASLRSQVSEPPSTNLETTHMTPGVLDPVPASCCDLLRVDDRLVRNLQIEIEATRGLLSEYEALAAAQRREIEAYSAMQMSCERRRRIRRRRSRTFVAAAVVVTLVALADR